MTQTLRLIGYWLGPQAPGWPDVRSFVDPAPDPARQDRVVRYLRGGTTYVAAAGFSICRLCGDMNGSTELTDGTHMVWPEGLAHYIEAHDIRLPDEVTSLMDEVPPAVDVSDFGHRMLETGELAIDYDWWSSLNHG